MNYLNFLLLPTFFLLIYGNGDMSLWDHIIKKEHVVLTVEYRGRYLNVWRQDSHGYSRFYVTPLCVMNVSSVKCSRDEYSHEHRHIFAFHIKLWDTKAAKVVQAALKRKNIIAQLDDILPLPMQSVRIGLVGRDLIPEVDNQWRSNQDQPHIMPFELFTRHEHFCDKMVNDVKNNSEHFFRGTKMYFEFTMVVGQTASRNFNITGNVLAKSSFFSQLENVNADRTGTVYLQSKDINRLARDIFNKVAFEEEVSANYIPSNQENQIVADLMDVLKEHQVQSDTLIKEEWDSVFWDDIFSRPDILTEYAKEVLIYNNTENKFKLDTDKDRRFRESTADKYSKHGTNAKSGEFSLFKLFSGNGKTSNSNNENKEHYGELEKNERDTINLDTVQKAIHKNNVNIKWNGQKFEPKDLTLYRLNTKTLKTTSEIYFKRVIVTKMQSTQKIEIKAEIESNDDDAANEVILSQLKNVHVACPQAWSYLNATGYCYKTFNTYKLPWENDVKKERWLDAEYSCRIYGAHLASVHSEDEAMFISRLAYYANISDNCDGWGHAWIGGYTEEDNFNWKWTDGTPFDYTKWAPTQPDSMGTENCLQIHLNSISSDIPYCNWEPGSFNNLWCNTEIARFVCKKLPS